MDNENILITEFQFSMIANFFKKLQRQGPGSREQTLKALQHIPFRDRHLRIADIGCGTGAQTEVLANYLDCEITAIDLLPEVIETIKAKKFRVPVNVIQASMDALPLTQSDYDMIWAEGSIYNMGFENGFNYWKQFLKPNGIIAASDCTWLSTKHPDNPDWIVENCPEIDSISNKIGIIEKCGYKLLAAFTLPTDCWEEEYYQPIEARFDPFIAEYNGDERAKDFVARMRDEIAYYRKYGDCFGYVFYIAQKL